MRVIILDNIRSLHNVGAVFRTADAADFQKIYICGYTGCPPDRRIEKVSLGAEDFIEWEHQENAEEVCAKLKKEGFEIVALEQTKDSTNIFETKFESKNTAIILGNEVEGIRESLLEYADKTVEIPMLGKKRSLNVSVACGIALYQISQN